MGSGKRRKLWKKTAGYKRRYKKYHMPTKSKPGIPRVANRTQRKAD